VKDKILWLSDTGQVQWHRDFFEHGEVKGLYSRDKHSKKALFEKWMRYLYFVYGRDSIYAVKLLSDRREMVAREIMGGESWKQMEELLKGVIPVYINLQYDEIEQMKLKVFNDMDNYSNYLIGIPWSIVREENGISVDHPNTEAKLKAMKAVKEILILKDEIDKMVKKEVKKREGERERLFENPQV
jgi:hypothetical protein